MTRAQIVGDLVIATGPNVNGPVIPAALAAVAPGHLRFDGDGLIDASDLDRFAIDTMGEKHLPVMADDEWPVIDCSIDDALIRDGETWRVKTADDALAAAKADAVRRAIARADALTAPVLAAYPEAERAGWDKREAEARAIVAASDAGGDVAAAIAGTLIVKAMADAGDWTETETIAKAHAIIDKAEGFAAISAAVEGMRERAVAAIEASADEAALAATLQTLDADALALAGQFGLV
ncbi:hypothetical protein [Oceaniradius stylonematis]|uniref:hypothetical protein n=1 Tax=Oceaniradius stylonematis TaxID=2184161 RepID=UPI00273F9ECF|nr:hypothetical protein [Oceaniradius stylonematis]